MTAVVKFRRQEPKPLHSIHNWDSPVRQARRQLVVLTTSDKVLRVLAADPALEKAFGRLWLEKHANGELEAKARYDTDEVLCAAVSHKWRVFFCPVVDQKEAQRAKTTYTELLRCDLEADQQPTHQWDTILVTRVCSSDKGNK